jgi:hypothetical protein
MVPDLGGPKTCRSGSGSPTLVLMAVCYSLFSCVPTGWKAGMVEFVEDAKTFREIQVSY